MYEMNYFSLFCKTYLVPFLTFIIGTPILCCTTADLGIFGVAFARGLLVPVHFEKGSATHGSSIAH